jgi:aspartate kinase
VNRPAVVKLGGDALATPERIAAAAERVVRRRQERPAVVVASARRGVTDHLLALVEQVRAATARGVEVSIAGRIAADRAVASGEVVAASLLAAALEHVGVPAVVLDAREAGLVSDGRVGGATLRHVRPARLERLLAAGTVPVVAGFQGWYRGRVTTLGRGGSDITAVTLAAVLGAAWCELVKEPGALHTADPRLVPEARPVDRAGHRFLTELAWSGARVIHHLAAERAEREGVALRFTSLHADGEPTTDVSKTWRLEPVESVVLTPGHRGIEPDTHEDADVSTVTVVSGRADPDGQHAAVADRLGHTLRAVRRPHAVSFLTRARHGEALLRALHAGLVVRGGGAALERRLHAG